MIRSPIAIIDITDNRAVNEEGAKGRNNATELKKKEIPQIVIKVFFLLKPNEIKRCDT